MKQRIISIALCMLATLAATAQAQQQGQKKRPKIGLALGGGGAKGAAHIGALKVLEEMGIRPDYIAGTSIGSIVGGLYACGYTADEIGQTFLSQEWISLMTDRNDESRQKVLSQDDDGTVYVFGFPVRRKGPKQPGKTGVGLLRGEKVALALDSMICLKLGPDSTYQTLVNYNSQTDTLVSLRDEFPMLAIPFRAVAVDIKHVSEHVFSSGKLATAMRASMAIPGAFKPVHLDSLTLVDGGMLNNLPVDVVKDMGADIVIAIDLTQNKHEGEKERLSLQEQYGIGGLLDWVVSRPDMKKYKENCAAADVYINPDLHGYGPGSFNAEAMSNMITYGYETAKAQRKELKKLRK